MRIPIALLALTAGACHTDPHLVQHPTANKTFAAKADTTCGQELASAALISTGAKWGEGVVVVTCGPHKISGEIEVEYETARGGIQKTSSPFGLGSDNQRCLAGDAIVASAGGGGGGGGMTGETAGAGTAGSSATVAPAALVETSWPGDDICPAGEVGLRTLLPIMSAKPGGTIRVRLWSRAPQDLAGSVVRISHEWFSPSVSDEKYQAFLDKEEAKETKRILARSRIAEVPAEPQPTSSAPPPKAESRPPAPSRAALWMPGYWFWAKTSWVWIGGRWRIPDGDELVAAPRPPPVERDEAPPVAPSGGVVWIPGYWAWDLGASTYVWVAGAWQVPPSTGVVWQRARWQVAGRGAVFVPGGWIRR